MHAAVPALDQWTPITESLADHAVKHDVFTASTRPLRYEYIAVSPAFHLRPGQYAFAYTLGLRAGGVTIGLQDAADETWIVSNNHRVSETGTLRLPILRGRPVRIVLAACNHAGSAETELSLSAVTGLRTGGISAVMAALWRGKRRQCVAAWRTRCLPVLLGLKVRAMAARGRVCRSLPLPHAYRTVAWTPAGYAVRGIRLVTPADRIPRLLTADVGDDTVSSIPIRQSRFGKRVPIRFTPRSAPMHLGALTRSDGVDIPMVCVFNFDESHTQTPASSLTLLTDLATLEAENSASVRNARHDLAVRQGHWGFRGVAVTQYGEGGFSIAAVDRDKGLFHLFQGDDIDRWECHRHEVVDLEGSPEPIGIAALAMDARNRDTAYYLTCRNRPELIVLHSRKDGAARIVQRLELKGLSRSSVVVGRFRALDRPEVAMALWGGDPKDLNAPVRGEIMVAETNAEGLLGPPLYVQAGMHPTDVVAGDLDGDGFDELAVLHYGTGLTASNRTHTGGVTIYKHTGTRFVDVAHVSLPNPRIGYIADIDGDGRQELVVSLFFERALAVVKWT